MNKVQLKSLLRMAERILQKQLSDLDNDPLYPVDWDREQIAEAKSILGKAEQLLKTESEHSGQKA